ncbi:TetR/AcrR family transcriptional regulator [Amycolatopsis sp. NPDC049691]|uniref:TetR/AcrR family transcriptional regulator n=1 Tax=Amycolatopsis sp. NPDC049691 TaxID=3155155 RepID=UPI00343C20CB
MTDPRVARSRRAILDAAVELLVEQGFAGTTVEAIAARSGAAKTTIYRQWPDKHAVLRAAVESIVPAAAPSDTGSLHGDLVTFARDLDRILHTAPTSALIPGLLDAAERDPGLAKVLAAFTARRRKPVHDAVARAIARGEAAANTDPEFVADLFLGPLFYRRLLSREPLDDAFVERVVEVTLASTR